MISSVFCRWFLLLFLGWFLLEGQEGTFFQEGKAFAETPEETRAQSFIEDLGRRALSSLTDPEIAPQERQDRFRQLLKEGFDVPAIGRFVLGKYARQVDDGTFQRFLKVFEASLTKIYAHRFEEYMKAQFLVLGASQGSSPQEFLVKSSLTLPGQEPVAVEWRVSSGPGGKNLILDVRVEGVSMLATQRSEYASVIQRKGGVEGLIKTLEENNDS